MKATRRHELQHNTLNADMYKIIDFFKKHGVTIAWGITIAIGITLLIVWYTTSQSRQRLAVADEYANLKIRQANMTESSSNSVLTSFKALTTQTKVDRIAALACVDVGDIYAMKLLLAKADDDRDALTAEARKYYSKAIEKFSDQHLAVAKAHLGLGKLAESCGDLAAAEKEFRAVQKMKSVMGQPVAAMVELEMRSLKTIGEPVRMASTAPALPESATKPVTTQPVATQPVTAKPLTPKPATTQPVIIPPVTTQPATTMPVTLK